MSVPTAAISPAENFYEFALEALHQGNLNYAIRKLRFGLQQYPQDSKLHSLLSIAYFDTGELDLARSHASNALKLDLTPQDAPVFDKDLRDRLYSELNDIEEDDNNDGPEPDSYVPRNPKDPNPTSGIALNPYAVPVPVP